MSILNGAGCRRGNVIHGFAELLIVDDVQCEVTAKITKGKRRKGVRQSIRVGITRCDV